MSDRPAIVSPDDQSVTFVELFFDLVYVAALIQLGDQLSSDVSWSGLGRFAGVFAVLWWTWTGTTAFTNRFAVDDITHRLLVFVQMVAVGETSGQLEEMLGKVAEAGERDVEAAVLGITSLIEPVMIVSMGLVVGLIVLSILLPIFEMNQMIG